MENKNLLKKLAKEKKQALADCKKYWAGMMKREGQWNPKEDDLEHYLFDLNLEGWEDVGFFVGYLRGLDFVIDLLTDET